MSALSYWDEAEGPPVLVVPHFPSEGHSSLGEGISKTKSKIIYVNDEDLAAERQRMIIGMPIDPAQYAFFRASIRLACCHPDLPKFVASPISESNRVWSALSAAGSRLNGIVVGFVPSLDVLSQKSASMYRWIHSFQIRRAASAYQNNCSWPCADFLEKSAIRALSWHDDQTTLAFADGMDCVILCSCDKSYRSSSAIFSRVLKHNQQHQVTSLTWDPFCEFRLGVCCLKAILIWDVNPTITDGMETPLMVVKQPYAEDIFTAVFFTSRLAFIAANLHGKLREYDLFIPETEQSLAYQGIISIVLSPDKTLVGYFDKKGFLGVMKEDGLDSLLHIHVAGTVSALAWLPDSTALIFSKTDSSEIFSLLIPSPPTHLALPQNHQQIVSLGKFVGNEEEDFLGLCVEIRSLAWDKTGQRLAVLLENRKSKVTRCLLCATRLNGKGGLTLIRITGWIALPKADVPIALGFFNSKGYSHEPQGGILTLASRGGQISHFPFFVQNESNCSSPSLTSSLAQSDSRASSKFFVHLLICLTGPIYKWLKNLLAGSSMARRDTLQNAGFSSDLVNMNMSRWSAGPTAMSRITSFVENRATTPEKKDRLDEDILSRGLSPEECVEHPSADRYSDHHMSVDRSPDPACKAQTQISPLAEQIAALSFGSGANSRPSLEGRKFPLAKSTNNNVARGSDGMSMGLPSKLKFSE